MKVYLAGEISLSALQRTGVYEAFFKACKYRLFSYYYHSDPKEHEIHLYNENGIGLFLDSGAFSAFTKNTTIDLEQYAAYVNECPFYYPVANLDVIGDTGAQSFANMEKLAGLIDKKRLMPVYHQQDEQHWLDKILDAGYDYIALGGLVGTGASWSTLEAWLDHTWDRLVDPVTREPKIKVHGFGLTTIKALLKYPWYSVDSSSWMMSSIYGDCTFVVNNSLLHVVFSEQNQAKREINSRHYDCLPAAQQQVVDAYLSQLGINAKQCSEHWVPRSIVNAYAFTSLDAMAPKTFTIAQQGLF